MKDYQARGYIFESVIWRLLESNGYVNVTQGTLKGRGAVHQIDAYGLFSYPTPFIYPLRLLAEVKCYKTNIELHHIRNFVGVLKDISENYIVGDDSNRNTAERYTDAGCFFSISPFSPHAQNYAWAHNIFLVSFSKIGSINNIAKIISNFVRNTPDLRIDRISKENIVTKFWEWENNSNEIDYPGISIGIINDIYPVILVGETGWTEDISELIPEDKDSIDGVKTDREDFEFESKFKLEVFGKPLDFMLPNIVAKKIIERISQSQPGAKIFELDVPILITKNGNILRRILKININLPDRYLEHTNSLEV